MLECLVLPSDERAMVERRRDIGSRRSSREPGAGLAAGAGVGLLACAVGVDGAAAIALTSVLFK